jgi:glycosyltransferase involved in cell wall biosynthesis
MNLLILSRYDRLGASSRLRFFQYVPILERMEINVTVSSLFSDAYVFGLQQNKRYPFQVLSAFSRRISTLLAQRQFDLIWIEKEALPWAPAWLEQTLISSKIPYVLDYDDAVFHNYDLSNSLLVRAFLGGKHKRMIRGAAKVLVGNEYLAEYAIQAGSQEVELIPTVIDLDRYPLSATHQFRKCESTPIVGWVGQRSTGLYLASLKQLFHRLAINNVANFVAVGLDAKSLGLPMKSIPWSEQTEVSSIAGFDIGIMPLPDDTFARGKCGYKLIQYMACSLPVIASPVGINCQIVEHGVNGFLAETAEQWEQSLKTLLADPKLRQQMGASGRRKVESQYCLQVTGPKLVAVLKEAAKYRT